jgi:hypothetical protein
MTVANKILAGILTITDKHMEQFNTLLLDYYNTGEGERLKLFLYDHCIQGIEYPKQRYRDDLNGDGQ